MKTYKRLQNTSIVEITNDDGTKTFVDENSEHIEAKIFRKFVLDGGAVEEIPVSPVAPLDKYDFPRLLVIVASLINLLIAQGILRRLDLPANVVEFIDAVSGKTTERKVPE